MNVVLVSFAPGSSLSRTGHAEGTEVCTTSFHGAIGRTRKHLLIGMADALIQRLLIGMADALIQRRKAFMALLIGR